MFIIFESKQRMTTKKGLLDCVNFKAESVTVASKLGSWIGTKSATRYHFSYLPPFKWWLVSGFGCRRFLAKNRCENSFSLYASRGVISIVVDDFTFFCQSSVDFLNIHFCHSVLKIFEKTSDYFKIKWTKLIICIFNNETFLKDF